MVPALEEILAATKSMVFFGGAGVSTESGIPDFRSVDGLYHQKFKYPPETMLSHTFYVTPAAKQQVGETRKKRLAQRPAFFRFDNSSGV